MACLLCLCDVEQFAYTGVIEGESTKKLPLKIQNLGP